MVTIQSQGSSLCSQVQLDRDCIKEELQVFRHEHDKRVGELQRELASLQQQYDCEAATLRSRIGVLEGSLSGELSHMYRLFNFQCFKPWEVHLLCIDIFSHYFYCTLTPLYK